MQHLNIRFWLLLICFGSFVMGASASQRHIINNKPLHSSFPGASNGLYIHGSVSSQRTKQQNAIARMHLLAQIA